jgi:hypothetical protein
VCAQHRQFACGWIAEVLAACVHEGGVGSEDRNEGGYEGRGKIEYWDRGVRLESNNPDDLKENGIYGRDNYEQFKKTFSLRPQAVLRNGHSLDFQ